MCSFSERWLSATCGEAVGVDCCGVECGGDEGVSGSMGEGGGDKVAGCGTCIVGI